MPQSFVKRCFKCGNLVRVTKHEWKWTRDNFVRTAEHPNIGKAICAACHVCPLPVIISPVSIWEVTPEGFRYTLVDVP